MLNFVKIILPRSDISQVIDGLTARMLIWRATVEYIESGYPQSADCVEDCDDAQEANVIADHYKYLIEQINNQLDTQSEGESSFYIRLFHGRKDPNQEMDEWGFEGPIFGPYSEIQGVYCNYINLIKRGVLDMLRVHEDLVYYDGCYYGDWCIWTELPAKYTTTTFQQKKADLPSQTKDQIASENAQKTDSDNKAN